MVMESLVDFQDGKHGDLAMRALAFAKAAHVSIDQRRKYTGEPYIAHPVAVASIVSQVAHTEVMLAAALLHDTVEDTPVTLEEVEREFGVDVSVLVYWLTDISRKEDGNRAVRKAMDRLHIAQAPSDAQTIKVADLLDNTASIVANDPAFARVYLAEKAALLDVLSQAEPELLDMARKQLASALDLEKIADNLFQRDTDVSGSGKIKFVDKSKP
jgi:(p)ppGpp synthase/HD superfamily hydrolase